MAALITKRKQCSAWQRQFHICVIDGLQGSRLNMQRRWPACLGFSRLLRVSVRLSHLWPRQGNANEQLLKSVCQTAELGTRWKVSDHAHCF